MTRNFIDHNFVCSKGINTQTIFHPIPIFNIDSSSNEASQISEVVDIVLHYWTHLEQMLLTVSSLGKQKLILSYTWLKNYNPKVDWEKEEVCVIHCLPWCEGCCILQREQIIRKRKKVQAMQHCWTRPLLLNKEEKELKAPYRTNRQDWEPGDQLFITRLISKPSEEKIQASATISQWLVEGARQSAEM